MSITENSNDYPDTFYVWCYAYIPFIFFEEHNIRFPRLNRGDLQILLEDDIYTYQEIGNWLYSLICNRSYQLPKNEKYRSQADLSRLYYELSKEVWLKDFDFRSSYKSPEQLWFLIEYEGYKKLLENTGVFGKSNPLSKHNRYQQISKGAELINSLPNLELNHNSTRYTETHCEVLIQRAVFLAKNNQKFRRKFQSFGKEFRRIQRKIRDDSNPHCYIDQNGRVVTSKVIAKTKSFRS